WNVRVGHDDTPVPADFAEIKAGLLDKLRLAVQRRMVADVPVGVLLSGGVDSSLVVAAMQAQSSTPVRTYSIGFEAGEFDEAPFASAVAAHLGTDHTELYASNDEVLSIVPRLAGIYDEPFADSSQIPTFLVSTLARQHVTVALSGDGGDELFGGYLRYFAGRRVWDQMQVLPGAARTLLAGCISAMPIAGWDRLAAVLRPVLPGRYRYRSVGQKAHKVADVLRASDPDAVYLDLVSLWKSPAEAVLGGRDASIFDPFKPELGLLKDFSERMMFADTMTYLPDDLLVKVDRASMAVGLEVRAPFLDHRVVEFAWRQPVTSKIDKRTGKKLLKDLLYEYVPRELVERPKMGFGVPLADWLRGPLRDWAGDLLAAEQLQRDGYFLTDAIQRKWREHQSGEADWHYQLWPVLMFQAWLDAYER
ncbi:MAG: asparagine synthase C-terminal domain-containing protein, partial [Gammaproteobacteria bacterium]|nr:asparagine synthase C-terminal domain-containing protein [Gammaproteobacteria bacterium]